jgi:hypothetical protein
MRDANKWAKKHRAGTRRAQAIIDRQDRKRVLSPDSKSIHYKQDRESERRRNQIARGQLRQANGLAVASAYRKDGE